MTTIVKTEKKLEKKALLQVMKRFVLKKESKYRNIDHIHFDGESFIATDAHKLVRISREFVNLELSEPGIISTAGNVVYGETYPDTSRLIPSPIDSRTWTRLSLEDVKQLLARMDEALTIVKKDDHKKVTFELMPQAKDIRFKAVYSESTWGEMEYKSWMRVPVSGSENEKITLNADYMKKTFMSVKELMTKLDIKAVDFYTYGDVRPIHIMRNGVFDIIVLPIRMA